MIRLLKIVTVVFGLFIALAVASAVLSTHQHSAANETAVTASAPDLWTYDHRPAWARETTPPPRCGISSKPTCRACGKERDTRVWIDESVWLLLPAKAQQDELAKWSSYFKAKGCGPAVEIRTATNEHQLATYRGK